MGKGLVRTGFDQEKSAAESLEKIIRAAGIGRDDIQRIGGTGSGKKTVKFADDDVDDIRAMSRGAIFFFPDARTVVAVGAEEGRAAKIDEKGNPVDFEINLFSQRESELIQKYLQEHGAMPGGGRDDLDDLY